MTGPILVTERLELWRPQAGDLAGIVAMVAPDQVRLHLVNRTLSMAD